MNVHESLIELVGNTPLLRLRKVTRGLPGDGLDPAVLAKVEYFNPGGSVKDRIALRMIDAAEAVGRAAAGRHDRGADLRQHRSRAGAGGGRSAATAACSSAPTRSARTRSTCCGPTAPRSWCARPRSRPTTPTPTTRCRDRLARRDSGRLEARPVRQPGRTPLALRDDRAGDLAPDRRADHALRRRRRHRRHDLRRRALPQGGVRRPGADHRRRPGGLGLLRRHRAAATWSRASARTSGRRPTTEHLRRDHRGHRRRLLPDDAAAGARGGAAGRRIERHGRGRGAQRRRPAGPDDVVVVLLPDGGRGYLGKIFNEQWMADYGFLIAETAEPRVGDVLARKAGRRCPSSCTPIRPTPCATRSTSCASTTSPSCRC